jgi:hypothetical protein
MVEAVHRQPAHAERAHVAERHRRADSPGQAKILRQRFERIWSKLFKGPTVAGMPAYLCAPDQRRFAAP